MPLRLFSILLISRRLCYQATVCGIFIRQNAKENTDRPFGVNTDADLIELKRCIYSTNVQRTAN